jgi:hypothetical protein
MKRYFAYALALVMMCSVSLAFAEGAATASEKREAVSDQTPVGKSGLAKTKKQKKQRKSKKRVKKSVVEDVNAEVTPVAGK